MVAPPPLVLVVDDNADLVAALACSLRMWKFRTLTAFDGPSALALAILQPPDVIVLDLCMPGMEGFDVARCVRAQPGLEHTSVIALSGEDAKDRALAAGCCEFLRKPVDPCDLRRAVEEAVRRGRSSG